MFSPDPELVSILLPACATWTCSESSKITRARQLRADLVRQVEGLSEDQRQQFAEAYPDLAESAAAAAERRSVETGLGTEREDHELEIAR